MVIEIYVKEGRERYDRHIPLNCWKNKESGCDDLVHGPSLFLLINTLILLGRPVTAMQISYHFCVTSR